MMTIVGLFTLQIWYGSYLDIAHHGEWKDAPLNSALKAAREGDAQKLSSGKMPIGKAMEALGQRGRRGFPEIAPQPSEDLGAMSGWIHTKGFKPYEPRQVAAPEADPTEVPAPDGEAAPADGEAAPAEGEAAPAEGEAASAEGETAAPAEAAEEEK